MAVKTNEVVTKSRPGVPVGKTLFILDAFASRVPVVSTTITGVVDIVQAEETGLLVPPRNSIALAVALERIISDNDLAANIANSAYKYVVNNFDSRRVLQDQLDFIEYEFNSSLL